MTTPSWLVLQYTFNVGFSRSLTWRQHGLFTAYVSGHDSSNAPVSFQWLGSPGRVTFQVAVLMYKAVHGSTSTYLSQLVHVADLPGRRSLRSTRSRRLLVPSFRLSTVGNRAFPVAGLSIWNNLPDNMTSAPTLSTSVSD